MGLIAFAMEMFKAIALLSKTKIFSFLFFVFLALILLTSILLFFSVNINCIDSDQPFMWAGATDYAKGFFYEPRFYGQDYNSFLEPLFAVPLLWCKVPVYYALPIATHVLFLFPFLFTAIYLYAKHKKEQALVVLSVLLCMPVAYDIINALPRGFISGLFFTSFFVLSFINPRNLKFVTLNSLMACMGYFINPNSVIVAAPLLAYLFFINYRHKKYYIVSGLSLLSCIPLYFIFDRFYLLHPDYVVYGLNYSFGLNYFQINISHLDEAFEHISFFMEGRSVILILILLLIPILLYKNNRAAFYAFLIFYLVVLVSFFSGKVREGSPWPFYSYSRMYLGIPLVIGLFSSLINFNSSRIMVLLITLVFLFTGLKFYRFNKDIAYHSEERHWVGVHLVPLKTILGTLKTYKEIAEKNHVDRFLISNGFWLNTYVNYGAQAVYPDFPTTQETNSERRYWVREANNNKVYERFVFVSAVFAIAKQFDTKKACEVQALDDYGLLLVQHNTLTTSDFIKLVKENESK